MKLKYALIAIVSLGLLCALLIPAPAGVVAAENLAVNGDLEIGNTNGWDIQNASIDASVVYSGSYSLKLTATTAYSTAAYKVIPVRPNATVTVSFYYRYASSPTGGYHIFTYKGADTNSGTYSNADKSFSVPSGCNSISTWQQISYTFNSGDYKAVTLKFSPNGNGCTSPCYIDNLVVTAEGGDEVDEDPYLTSFGTKNNRPVTTATNLIREGGFESATDASWNVAAFTGDHLSVVSDPTAPEGTHSLYFNTGATSTTQRYVFSVSVEKYTSYTFSAWVKSPRLSGQNRATATFGVANAYTGRFMVYEPYDGNGYGSASLSTETMQLMATSPDDEWHLRSVTFYSGSHTTVNVAIMGARSQLYLDDIALYKSANGVEYISDLRTETLGAANNGGDKYCADEDSLIDGVDMSLNDTQLKWSKNPAWRNGFLSFVETGDSRGTVLKYTASAYTSRQLHYIDWVDVEPHTDYTLTLDVKRLTAGNGRIALLDDNILSPGEFYTIRFSATDSDWATYSVTFNTGVYSRIGFAIVDGGGTALMDEVRFFKTDDGIAEKPVQPEGPEATLKPQGGLTAVMDMAEGEYPVTNSDFEDGTVDGWLLYQQTALSADAAYRSGYGLHLKGDGTWGALVEQTAIPVESGKEYTLSFWYKVNKNGANVTVKGETTGIQYAYVWADVGEWTRVSISFTVEEDTSVVLNMCGGGNGVAEDVYVDNIRLIPEDTTALLGVAFRISLEGYHITMDASHRFDAPNATVIPYGDGESYRLLRMGAVMTNDASVGADAARFTLSAVNDYTVQDVPAEYLMSVSDTGCQYAVRVANVPLSHCATQIYTRPYYVFEKDGQEIVVYGDVYNRSYDG